jgi:mono/diheme cytochrome c family protein
VAAVVWAAAVTVGGAQDAGPAPVTAVYTEGQALRGREAYTTACAHCHSSDLLGDVRLEIPSLAEDDFVVRWGNRTAAELLKMISTDMPADKPGQLTAAAYADILAYILQVNGFPAGATELRPDAASLDQLFLGKPE